MTVNHKNVVPQPHGPKYMKHVLCAFLANWVGMVVCWPGSLAQPNLAKANPLFALKPMKNLVLYSQD